MGFVVEDGTGQDDATSYASVEDFISYFADRGTDYTDTEPEAIQAALIKATDYVEQRFQHRWKGRRNTQEQALSWPRSGVLDRDGAPIATDALPVRLVRAVFEYAKRALTAELMPDPTVDPNVKRTKTTVGPISEEIEYSGGAAIQTIKPYPTADRWLNELLTPAGGVMR